MFNIIHNDYSIGVNIIEKKKKSIENKMWGKGIMKSRKQKRTR